MAGNTIKFLIEMRDSASGPLKKVGKAAEESGKDAKGASTKFTELSSKLHLMGMAAKAAQTAVTMIAKPMILLGKESIGAGAQMEGFETRLNVLMGSSSMAKQRLEELFKIGSTTPFQLPGLIEAEVNMRALGVNAEETLPLVMDFAGAMGVDVARAAVEVGRAMQFGAGAVETIAGRALRAQVELKTGGDALKMSTEEFKAALIETLTDEQGIFKGGTDKLAATFDGMISNMQDAWFKFTKQVADSQLFKAAQLSLKEVLRIIGDNEDATSNLAGVVGNQLTGALLAVVAQFGLMLSLIARAAKAFNTMERIGSAFAALSNRIHSSWTGIILGIVEAGRALQDTLGNSTKTHDETIKRLKAERKLTHDQYRGIILNNDALKKQTDQLDETIEKYGNAKVAVEDIKLELQRLDNTGVTLRLERPGQKGGGKTPTPDAPEKAAEKAEKGKKLPTAEEMEKAMRASLEGTEASLRESLESLQDLQYKLSPAGLAEGMVNKLSDSFGTMTAMMGPAGGLVSGLSELGKSGAKPIIKALKESIKGLIVGLVEVLPALIVEIPRILIDAIPDLIEGILSAIPALLEALFIGLPTAIFQGLGRWFKIAWETIKAWFSPGIFKKGEEGREKRAGALGKLADSMSGFGLLKPFLGKKQTGAAHIDRTGLALLHAGEAIVPSNGANSQSVAGRMGRGGGTNVTINTNVVDSNAIRGLGKLLEREFGSFGRSTSPVFNSPTGTSG